MEKSTLPRLGLIAAVMLAVAGCTAAISKPLRNQADETIAVSAVRENPRPYMGEIVIWGGEIIDATHLPAATHLKVLQKPLDFQLQPKTVDVSEGRFVAVYEGFLDSEIYSRGRKVTVAGELTGVESLPIGETQYTYPTVKVREIHLWPRPPEMSVDDYYGYPYYHPFHPWRYYPYWR